MLHFNFMYNKYKADYKYHKKCKKGIVNLYFSISFLCNIKEKITYKTISISIKIFCYIFNNHYFSV